MSDILKKIEEFESKKGNKEPVNEMASDFNKLVSLAKDLDKITSKAGGVKGSSVRLKRILSNIRDLSQDLLDEI